MQSLKCVLTSLCAITCINIYAHVKDPVGHVRVRWINETLKHPVGLVSATLSLLVFSGERKPNFPWEKPYWDNTVVKKNFLSKNWDYQVRLALTLQASLVQNMGRVPSNFPSLLQPVGSDHLDLSITIPTMETSRSCLFSFLLLFFFFCGWGRLLVVSLYFEPSQK